GRAGRGGRGRGQGCSGGALGWGGRAGAGPRGGGAWAGWVRAVPAAAALPLAARALGALDAVGQPQASASTGVTRSAVPADLADALQTPAYAIYAEEGRAGGMSLIVTLYPR